MSFYGAAALRTYAGDEAFIVDREAKLHKPFVYPSGKAGNLFHVTGLDGKYSSVYSVLILSLSFPGESVAAA